MNMPEAGAEELASDTLFAVSSHISSGGKAKLPVRMAGAFADTITAGRSAFLA